MLEDLIGVQNSVQTTATIDGKDYVGAVTNNAFSSNAVVNFLFDQTAFDFHTTYFVEDGYQKVSATLYMPAVSGFILALIQTSLNDGYNSQVEEDGQINLLDAKLSMTMDFAGGIESVTGGEGLYTIEDGVITIDIYSVPEEQSSQMETVDELFTTTLREGFEMEIVGILGVADEGPFPYSYDFADVSEGAWYADALETTYGLGIINGTTDTTFDPDGTLTLAQIVVMASRAHALILGDDPSFTVEAGQAWYTPYVNYAVENGIIEEGVFTDFTQNATRAEMAYVIAHTTNENYYNELVEDVSIADMDEGDDYYDSVYTLYSAGIVTGTGTGFEPAGTLNRAQAAVFIARLLDYSQRVSD